MSGSHSPDDDQNSAAIWVEAATAINAGDHGRAEALLRRALAIDKKNLGPDHPEVSAITYNLTEVQRAMGAAAESHDGPATRARQV
jgi:hypothetical protein